METKNKYANEHIKRMLCYKCGYELDFTTVTVNLKTGEPIHNGCYFVLPCEHCAELNKQATDPHP